MTDPPGNFNGYQHPQQQQNPEYSTLEVASESSDVRSGQYPEVVPYADGQYPEAYGYYDPVKAEQDAAILAAAAQKPLPDAPYSQQQQAGGGVPYASDPEVVIPAGAADISPGNGGTGGKGRTICGIRRRTFWIAAAVVALAIIGLVAGLAAGLSREDSSKSTSSVPPDGDESPPHDGGGNGNGGNGNGNGNGDGDKKGIRLLENTSLATANFTDAYGNENYLVVYQLSDASIRLSAFNSSHNGWVSSTVVNGTTGEARLATPLSIDTNWKGSATPDVTVHFLSTGSLPTVQIVQYSSTANLPTGSGADPAKWTATGGMYNAMPGSSLASYGKQCEWCNQYSYMYWQNRQGILSSAENDGPGFEQATLVDVAASPPTNTSMALTYSGTLTGDGGAILRRSLNLFYRTTKSGLVQLRIGNGVYLPQYVGRDVGPRTRIAAFSTGFNESDALHNPTPLGFQVLTLDPDERDGVQLSYMEDGQWTVLADEVVDLADCKAKATMAANRAQRLYCLVDDGDGVGIVEWAWKGQLRRQSTYSSWQKVGVLDLGL